MSGRVPPEHASMVKSPRRRALLVGALAVLALPAMPIPASAQPAGIPPPPSRRHESIPPNPAAPRLVWQPGHWSWDEAAAHYRWRPGQHIVRRLGAKRFISGKWVQTNGDWSWRRAHWR